MRGRGTIKVRTMFVNSCKPQVRVLRHMELSGHLDDPLHRRRLHLPDDRSPRRLVPIQSPVLLCTERPSPLLEAAGALAD